MRRILDRLKKRQGIENQVEALVKKHKKLKLNVGCGTDYKKGWINIDNNSDNNIEDGKLDLDWDLRNPLPFPDNSVDFIFHEHFIEHLTVEEGQAVLKDFNRVLKEGGVMRIATPDLAVAVDKYLNLTIEQDNTLKKFGLEFIQTRAERMNIGFRWWGHKWIYDWEELERRLREAGFSNIKRRVKGRSNYKELAGLEIRTESTLVAEVKK